MAWMKQIKSSLKKMRLVSTLLRDLKRGSRWTIFWTFLFQNGKKLPFLDPQGQEWKGNLTAKSDTCMQSIVSFPFCFLSNSILLSLFLLKNMCKIFSFRFMVSDTEQYIANLSDPDLIVEWSSIEQVVWFFILFLFLFYSILFLFIYLFIVIYWMSLISLKKNTSLLDCGLPNWPNLPYLFGRFNRPEDDKVWTHLLLCLH